MQELHLTKKDFNVDWFSGTGGGGQHRNKHMNCCRITHIATGLRATGQSHRDRPSNQAEAFERLARLVIAYYAGPAPDRRMDGPTIRTYHEKRGEVKDHRSGATAPYREVLEGKAALDHLVTESRSHHAAQRA